jgi:(S)-ureidoglycine-glyoxylate aminotransferase
MSEQGGRPKLELFEDLAPAPRMLMGPGPINADPRVLRAMSAPLLGQFDPQFRAYMRETMSLYRGVFCTSNEWTFVVDGTARAAIEAAMASLIEPGDTVLVASFGRFGQLMTEIARRCGAKVEVISREWGDVFTAEEIETALRRVSPKLVAVCQGDTSTTMLQPLAEIGPLCRRHGVMLQVDATASLGGTPLPVDAWQIDMVTAGLQKCLGGPSGSAPITFSDEAGKLIYRRRHIEEGLRTAGYVPGVGRMIASNYFDLAMVMDYWSERALNHHTEATSMLYGARECARVLLGEGLQRSFERHARAGAAFVAGVEAMGLKVFGDKKNKLPHVTGIWIPPGVDGDRVRGALLRDFNIEIGTSFGPLHGKIWRVGTMGYNARKDCVLITLGALEAVLAAEGAKLKRGAAADAALDAYKSNEH